VPEVDRSVFAISDGLVGRVGWENPANQAQGFGYRVYVEGAGGSSDIYAHLSPASVSVATGDRVIAGQRIGEYASPANGTATAPHLHVERRDARGNSIEIDWAATRQPVSPTGRNTSPFGNRTHPVTGQHRLHGGYDFVGGR
jgi:murein DD-endopeptidase MepM/ murein hydrolase activator NlpD